MSESPAADLEKVTPPATVRDGESGASEGDNQAVEHGGRGGLDPTRYGDWEKNGRCIDF